MNEYNDMYEYNDEDGGIQFQPYDDELINEYLIPKLEGKPRGEITMKDVYSKEPWLLDHPMGNSFFKKNEWYYFATRTQLSKKKIGCGQKAKRRITRDDDSGFWRTNAKGNIWDKENKIIGEKQTLGFVKSKVNNKKKQKSVDSTSCDVVVPGSESSWIMTEYMLPEIKGRFCELVLCKFHVIENSNKNKKNDDRHEASTSSNHHHHNIDPSTSSQQPMNIVDHGTFVAPYLDQQPTNMYHPHIDSSTLVQQPNNIVNRETFLAPYLEQQPMNVYHHHIDDPSTSAQQPNNIVDHGTFLAPYLEQQLMNMYHHHIDPSTSTQQPMNFVDYGTFLAPTLDQQSMNMHHHHIDSSTLAQQPMNFVNYGTFLAPTLDQQPNNIVDHGTFRAPYLEQQPMNLYDESFQDLSASLEQQPTNIIQENKKDDHEAYTPNHDHESLADFFTKQRPVNEVHGHVPEISLIGSKKNDQVLFEASSQVSEKHEEVYIDAPLVCLGSKQEAKEGGGGWIQGFVKSLTTLNVSSLPMEENDGTLIYDTSSFVDQDLLDQYATLRPQEKL